MRIKPQGGLAGCVAVFAREPEAMPNRQSLKTSSGRRPISVPLTQPNFEAQFGEIKIPGDKRLRPYRELPGGGLPETPILSWCKRLWVLKNSPSKNLQKLHRVRTPRLSLFG